MKLTLIYDDSVAIPGDIAAMTGIAHFGSLLYRRRKLEERLRAAALSAGLEGFVSVSDAASFRIARETIVSAPAETQYLFCPSNVVAMRPAKEFELLLKQLKHAGGNVVIPVGSTFGWTGLVMREQAAAAELLGSLETGSLAEYVEKNARALDTLNNNYGFVDLRDRTVFLSFLTSNFDVRHFNAIQGDEYTITKASKDKAKLKREYAYYELLPPQLQYYFVRPFDFKDGGSEASYRMERLFVPDMAVQWVHGAVGQTDYERFLDRVFNFVSSRPRRAISRKDYDAELDRLYITKVVERIEDLKKSAEYEDLKPLLQRAVGGIDRLVERYKALFAKSRSRFTDNSLCIGHGDLCFSNILYSKANQLLRLIDPRGALKEDELYTCPYYDVAKLSHSIQGNYDFINNGLFEITVGDDLSLKLQIDSASNGWPGDAFNAQLDANKFDKRLVRLCEASLFISMVPLHREIPRKMLGFLLNADAILTSLERG